MGAINIAEQQRREFALAWWDMMIKIWRERIQKLGVVDTGGLFRTVMKDSMSLNQDASQMVISETFREYGIWQELGVGRETPHGNPGDIGKAKVREKRKWMGPKYFGSVMAMKEFMADNLAEQFVGLIAEALDKDTLKSQTAFYQRKGY